jgi:hypothetical protein
MSAVWKPYILSRIRLVAEVGRKAMFVYCEHGKGEKLIVKLQNISLYRIMGLI